MSGHDTHSDPVSKLIYELSKLPGIGEKTATRLAYFVLKQDEGYSASLAEALVNAYASQYTIYRRQLDTAAIQTALRSVDERIRSLERTRALFGPDPLPAGLADPGPLTFPREPEGETVAG